MTAPAKSAPGGGRVVLLVDDEELIHRIARRVLEDAGYRVLEAWDGDEAERVFDAAEGTIQLVVTDVIMPRSSGPDLVRRLQFRRPDLKFLYMSGYVGPGGARAAGIDRGTPFMPKPFSIAELLDHVRSALDP